MTDIVKLLFHTLKAQLSKNGIHVEISNEAIQLLAERGYDPIFGARPIKRVIQRDVLNELSKLILAGKVNKEKPMTIDVEKGEYVFRN